MKPHRIEAWAVIKQKDKKWYLDAYEIYKDKPIGLNKGEKIIKVVISPKK
jgi:hypothetical protein